jgi:hypothetical protein
MGGWPMDLKINKILSIWGYNYRRWSGFSEIALPMVMVDLKFVLVRRCGLQRAKL